MSRPAFVERERKSVADRGRIGEVVFGVQDGITSAIGILSSLVGGHQGASVIVFVGGAAAFAGMFSMAAGAYLSSRAELDVARIELARERRRIRRDPEHEIDELSQIYRSHGMPRRMAEAAALRVARHPRRMLSVMAAEEFGVDVEIRDDSVKNALAMAASFVVGALGPIVPFLVLPVHAAFAASIGLSSAALFGVGLWKARVVGLPAWRSGLQTFAFGAAAAALGYLVGTLLPLAFGLRPAL